MKKLAEAGDWKAALIIGLTYEFRFVCEKEECELAIRPLFENSRSLSNREAVIYFRIAAKHNSVEACAALGRMRFSLGCLDQERAVKDNNTGKERVGRIILGRRRVGRIILGRRRVGRIILGRRRVRRIILGKRRVLRIILGRRRVGRIILGRRRVGRIILGRRRVGRIILGGEE